MRGKLTVLIALLVALVFVVGCQIPQYTVPSSGDADKEVKDITKELEQLTEEVTKEPAKELTPEEKAREEFKQKLLEKQQPVEEAPVVEEAPKVEPKVEEAPKVEPKVEEAPKVEPKVEEAPKVEPKVEEAPKQEIKLKVPPKTVTTPTRNADGKLQLVINEGDTVALKLKATDPDGDPLSYTFSKPLDKDGKWVTKIGDAGTHVVTVGVSDGKLSVEDELRIIVNKVNHAPVLEAISAITVKEGETVIIAAKATDQDGDTLSYTYTGWMTSSTYATNYNEAGVHEVTVTVSDGIESASQKVKVTVEDVNRAPVLSW